MVWLSWYAPHHTSPHFSSVSELPPVARRAKESLSPAPPFVQHIAVLYFSVTWMMNTEIQMTIQRIEINYLYLKKNNQQKIFIHVGPHVQIMNKFFVLFFCLVTWIE